MRGAEQARLLDAVDTANLSWTSRADGRISYRLWADDDKYRTLTRGERSTR
jgi:hypothetical protein